jgi:hypothetical protein
MPQAVSFGEGRINLINDKELRRRLKENREVMRDGEAFVLHVWEPTPFERKRAPFVFRNWNKWGHLFGRSKADIVRLAKAFGVRKIRVHREDRRGQHIDLCGQPLIKLVQAIKACEEKS